MIDPHSKPSYLPYGDLLRAIGAFMVICVHALNGPVFVTTSNQSFWWFYAALKAWGLGAVPLFLMLSGAIFLATPHTPNLSQFYLKRWQRLWPALLGWGLFYGWWSIQFNQVANLWVYLQGGLYYHFYFLFIMIWLYALTPWLRRLQLPKNRWSLWWVMGGSALASVWHWWFMYQVEPHPLINIHLYVGSVGYYVLGGWLGQKVAAWPRKYFKISLVVALALTTAWCVWWVDHHGVNATGTIPPISVLQPLMALAAVSMFGLIASSAQKWNLLPWRTRLTSLLSAASLHCYLGHVVLLELTAGWLLPWKTTTWGPVVVILEAIAMYTIFNFGYWLVTRAKDKLSTGFLDKLRYNKLRFERENSSAG